MNLRWHAIESANEERLEELLDERERREVQERLVCCQSRETLDTREDDAVGREERDDPERPPENREPESRSVRCIEVEGDAYEL